MAWRIRAIDPGVEREIWVSRRTRLPEELWIGVHTVGGRGLVAGLLSKPLIEGRKTKSRLFSFMPSV